MYNKTAFRRGAKKLVCTSLPLAIGAGVAGMGNAEVEGDLDTLVVSALRMPGDSRDVTSAVDVLDPREFEERQIFDLRQALNEVPGVIATSTSGQSGAIGSVFIRGTTTSYSQLVVDGIRLSDSTAPLGNFFAGARLDDLARIEVLRGPQAAVHGGESVGGVVWLETARGLAEPQTSFRLEGGSFETLNGYVSTSGMEGALSWFLGAGYDGSHNDATGQDFDQGRTAARIEWAGSEVLTVGATFRLTDSRFEYLNFGENTDYTDANLATVYANAQFSERWLGRFTLGNYVESYDNEGAFGGFGTDLNRTVFSTDQTYLLSDCHTILGGAFVERTDFENTIGVDQNEIRYGGYLGWRWSPLDSVTTDAVARWEDYAEYEEQVTWRVGASWRLRETTRLRMGIGKAFRTPTLLDLNGTLFGAGNPDLEAESSIGWDVGIEQRFADKHALAVTYFENSVENRIQSFPTPPVNLDGDTPTRGVEVSASGELGNCVSYRFAYTWLDESLADQPENTANASVDWRTTEKLTLGVGATYVDERSYGGEPLEDYLLVRAYVGYAITDHIGVHARVENILDDEYELSNFFGNRIPGAGLGTFVGINCSF